VHFNKDLAKSIVSEMRNKRWKLSVLLTGGGEPLLCPNLVDICDVFGRYERLNNLSLITSGFTNDEPERKQQLETLLKRFYGKRMLIDQSFNMYHDSFPERLSNMIQTMLKARSSSYLGIRACMSLNNFSQTQKAILKVLSDLAKDIGSINFPIPLGWQAEDRKFFHIFENQSTSDVVAARIAIETYLTPAWHAIKTERGGLVVLVQPISFEQTGHGENIEQKPYAKSVCNAITDGFSDTYLIVTPDGSVYPDCSCHPHFQMKLGKIGETSLQELVLRKDIFSQRIARAILSDSRMCQWGTKEVCTICRQIVAEKGIALE
jgi:hypothetical protein